MFKIALAGIFVFLVVWGGSIATISKKYQLPPLDILQMWVRKSILTLIAGPLAIYDPWVFKEPVLGPDKKTIKEIQKQFVRAEKGSPFLNQGTGLHLISLSNEKIITSPHNFRYQPYGEPILLYLRKEFKLDDVVKPARSELEALVLLRNWARSRFQRKDFHPQMKVFNALDILRRNYHNSTKEPYNPTQYRPCHFFPLLYSQVLLSMGYQPRLMRISLPEDRGYNGHGLIEVWSNQFKKWITMDPDLNLHYEKDGLPLNLLEVHNARYSPIPAKIKIVRSKQTSGDNAHLNPIHVEEMIRYHSYIQIMDMRNDWLTNHYFRGHPRRSDQSGLMWVDPQIPPVFTFKPKTTDPDDFYWSLNQTEIWVKKNSQGKEILFLAFKTVTPNFKHFEIQLENKKRINTTNPFFNWELHPGKNSLQIHSINKFGLPGIPSRIELILEEKTQG